MAVKEIDGGGRWYVYGRKGYWPEDPSRTREYFETEADALERDAELKTLRPKGQRRRIESVTVLDLVKAYRAATRPGTERSTQQSSYYKFRRLLKFFGRMEASKVLPRTVRQYVAIRMDEPITAVKVVGGRRVSVTLKDREGNSRYPKRSTIRREVADLKAAFAWAASEEGGLLDIDPIRSATLPKLDDEIIPPPTAAEFRAILEAAAPHLRRALTISYYTGLRPGIAELLGMTWDQVDIDGRCIIVISARKGGASLRRIPVVDDWFLAELIAWKAADAKIGQTHIIHYAKDPNEKPGPVASIKTAWKKAKQRAGITRRLRPYDMRHMFATDLLNDGADLKAVSQMLGHSRPDTTIRIYQHSGAEAHRIAVGKRRCITSVLQNGEKKPDSDNQNPV